MILLTARIEVMTPERRELAHALVNWANAARRETGARGSRVFEDIETPGVFCLVSQWESRATFEAHLRGLEFGIVVGALELLARPPEVSVTQNDDGIDSPLTLRRLRDHSRRSWLSGPSRERHQ